MPCVCNVISPHWGFQTIYSNRLPRATLRCFRRFRLPWAFLGCPVGAHVTKCLLAINLDNHASSRFTNFTNNIPMTENTLLVDLQLEFRRYRQLADRALAEIDDETFFRQPGELVNPIALIVKHIAGNLKSRWTDLLTTDGEKPSRNRDDEFVLGPNDSRASLMAAWATGWAAVEQTLPSLSPADLPKTVTIRGEPHTVQQAVVRSLSHTSYHVGQILYLVRLCKPDAKWQTIAPGQSGAHRPGYRSS
jgi:hypothetical protein